MTTVDDITIIQKFVHGEITRLANQNFCLESGCKTAQLFSRKGGVMATAKLVDGRRLILLRSATQYDNLINQILGESGFLPIGQTKQGLMRYEHRPIPQGYEINYTEARALWRTWWTQERYKRATPGTAELLIAIAGNWQVVQKMTFSPENLLVQTAGVEMMLPEKDRLVWLSPSKTTEPATQIFNYIPKKRGSRPVAPPPQATGSLAVISDRSLLPTTAPSKQPGLPGNAVRFHHGKLYIQTTEGEIVVEGTNLKFWIKPADLNPLSGQCPKTLTESARRDGLME
jgi:hypothetical protein